MEVARVHMFGNNLNESKFYSGRNEEQIEVRKSLLSFDNRIFCLPGCYPSIQRLRYTER